MKTKFELSMGATAAIGYALGLFSGYIALFAFAIFIFLTESDEWLKRQILKACVIVICFSVLNYLINFIPSVVACLESFGAIFVPSAHIPSEVLVSLQGFLNNICKIGKDLLLFSLGFLALSHRTCRIVFIDRLIDHHYGKNATAGCVCPSCGALLKDDITYCPQCGEKLR